MPLALFLSLSSNVGCIVVDLEAVFTKQSLLPSLLGLGKGLTIDWLK